MHSFIYKLFPFNSLFNLDSNTLTAWWVLVTILIFLVGILYFCWKIFSISRIIIKYTHNFSLENISNDKVLSSIWEDYENSWISFNQEQKSYDNSYEYINETTVISYNINIKFINAIPSLLIGLGILGTFVGLTYGISDFDTSSQERIQSSINILLSGMGTAFISSVWGMLLSLLFIVIERLTIDLLHKKIIEFCKILDKRFKFSKTELTNYEIERQILVIKEFFVSHNEDGKELTPANIFRDLLINSDEQTKSLKSFSTDLADGIKISSETVNLLGGQLGKIIDDINNKQLIPLFNNLLKSIEEIKNIKEESSSKFIQDALDSLNNNLKNVVEDFKDVISKKTKEEITNLSSILKESGAILLSFPDKLERIVHGLSNSFIDIQTVLAKSANDSSVNIQSSIGNLKMQIEELSSKLTANIEGIQYNQLEILKEYDNKFEKIHSIISDFENTIQKNMELNIEICKTSDHFREIGYALSRSTTQINSSLGIITQGQSELRKHIDVIKSFSENYIEENKKILSQVIQAIEKASRTSLEYTERFKTIETGIQGIFRQINDGLNNYQKNVAESINKYLTEFSTLLTSSQESLSGNIQSLSEILEDINEGKEAKK